MHFSFKSTQFWCRAISVSWVLIQIPFFLPKGWPPGSFFRETLQGPCGKVTIFRQGRHADLWGACSDRFQRFSRYELVPALRKRGVSRINKIVLDGHNAEQIGALNELQKNFAVRAVYYPQDRAERMRKTFQAIGPGVQVRRRALLMGS